MDDVKEQLDELVSQLGYKDYEDYLKSPKKGSTIRKQSAQKKQGMNPQKSGVLGNRSMSQRLDRMLQSGDKLVSKVIMDSSSPILSTFDNKLNNAKGRYKDDFQTPNPMPATTSTKDYEKLLVSNSEMREVQIEQKKEIQELKQALLALQSQSFTSPFQVINAPTMKNTSLPKTHDDLANGFTSSDFDNTAEQYKRNVPELQLVNHHPRIPHSAISQEVEGMVKKDDESPMMAYEDLVDFELQRLQAIVDETKAKSDNKSSNGQLNVNELISSTTEMQDSDAAVINENCDTFLISKSELDAAIAERVNKVLLEEIDRQYQMIVDSNPEIRLDNDNVTCSNDEQTSIKDPQVDLDGNGPPPSGIDKAFKRLIDAISEGIVKKRVQEIEDKSNENIDRLRSMLQEKTGSLTTLESSLTETVIPSLKRFETLDEKISFLQSNINEIHSKVENIQKEDNDLLEETQKRANQSKQMLDLFGGKLKDIEDTICDIKTDSKTVKTRHAEKKKDEAISTVEAVGIEATLENSEAETRSREKDPKRALNFLTDPTMKDMIGRLDRLENIVKIIAKNDYKHIKSLRASYLDKDVSIVFNSNDLFNENDEYFQFSESLSQSLYKIDSGAKTSTARETIRDKSVINRDKPQQHNLITSRHMAQALNRAPMSRGKPPLHSKSSTIGTSDQSEQQRQQTSTARKVADEAVSRVRLLEEHQEQMERKMLVLLKTEGESRRINILELWGRVRDIIQRFEKSQDEKYATKIEVAKSSNSTNATQKFSDQKVDETPDRIPDGLVSNKQEYYIEQVVSSLRGSISAVDAKAERLRSAITAVRRTALLADAKCGAVAAEFVKLYRQIEKPSTKDETSMYEFLKSVPDKSEEMLSEFNKKQQLEAGGKIKAKKKKACK